MDRAAVLEQFLAALVDDRPHDAAATCQRAVGHDGDPYAVGLVSYLALWLGAPTRPGTGRQLGEQALAVAGDAEALALARAVAGLAVAFDLDAVGIVDPVTGGDPLDAFVAEQVGGVGSATAWFAAYVAAEGALCSARLDIAATIVARGPHTPPPGLAGCRAFTHLVVALRARLALFAGRTDDARLELTSGAPEVQVPRAIAPFLDAVAGLVDDVGRRPHRRLTEARRVCSADANMFERGGIVIEAYAHHAAGAVDAAAATILAAGGGPDLDRLLIVDRALGFEILVTAAIVAGDIDAASAWMARADDLAAHPVAAPTVERIRSALLLHVGDPEAAVESASDAAAAAAKRGRTYEARSAELVAARAELADARRVPASQRLLRLADNARADGDGAALARAAAMLRQLGRRPPPIAGAGWEALSARERDVARLVAGGLSNVQIASSLYVSTHTVRAHVSRVLAAFGVASRMALVGAIAGSPGPPPTEIPDVTERQAEVLALLVRGERSGQIAEALGITPRTVAKHVGDLLRRYGVSTRAELVHRARVGSSPPMNSPI